MRDVSTAGRRGRSLRGRRPASRSPGPGDPPARRRPSGSAGCRPPSSRLPPARRQRRAGRRTPCQGSVSSSTPAAATRAHRRAVPRPRAIATPSGPRNSNALAVPSGSRSTAAMNRIVTPAVTTPRATQESRLDRVKADGRGRTSTSQKHPRPRQSQPGHPAHAELVHQPDRGGQAQLHKRHRRQCQGRADPGRGPRSGVL